MNFNSRIAAFFLRNTRLTALAFILLLALAAASTILLKTTGFPSPDVNFAMVQTTYPGASSETVVKDVTVPVEGAIKEVKGISSMSSQSVNSLSFVNLTLDEDADSNKVMSDIDSALSSLNLPDSADDPKVIVPDIAGADFMYSITGENLVDIYESYQSISSELTQIRETAQVRSSQELNKEVLIRLKRDRMSEWGISEQEVIQRLNSLDESIPVGNNLTIDHKNSTLVTSIDGTDWEELKSLPFGDHQLKDFSTISIRYQFKDDVEPVIAYENEIHRALTFEIYTVENIDMTAYYEEIQEVFEPYNDDNKVQIFENLSTHEQNQMQVDEVMSGLIGSPFNVEGPQRNLGYLFGGIQLVFFVMVLFVSFRAALIGALAIPLSLVFSTIYVFLTGNNLNTLVLFSLVLVIGLVVDPALVILESIQRKIDAGYKGKEAAMEAVRDVGNGLFLATLTNIIVFAPFGLVSGLLGEIISYIPLTIIPAVVGSYVVPLVFLAWIGSFFLKRNKRHTGSEEENLWLIAKGLRSVNLWLVKSPKAIRGFILLTAFLFPMVLTSIIFSQGHIKSVQFSGSQNSEYLAISAVHFPKTSIEDQATLNVLVMKQVIKHEDVEQIFFMEGFGYFVTLEPSSERDLLSIELAKVLDEQVRDKYGRAFFDLSVAVLSDGPPAPNYQVQLAVHTDDLVKLREAALAVGETLGDACLKDNEISVDAKCEDGLELVVKVDDGYTNKSNTTIEVILDPEKLQEKQLLIPNAPLSIMVNQMLREVFTDEDGIEAGTIQINGQDVPMILVKTKDRPDTLKEIRNLEIFSMSGEVIKLSDIASIEKTAPKTSIQRVNGETIAVVKARLEADNNDQASAALVTQAVLDFYQDHDAREAKLLGLESEDIELYQEGDLASFTKSFQELFAALFMAIFLTYVVLVVFFESFTMPLVILFTIPLTFVGVFPALALWGGGEFGFLEIIGLIILVGLVENVAIFLIDLAKQKINEGWDEREAIAYASAVRLRPVILTTFTAIASLAPLAVTSDQYRSMAIVIMFGLLTSGATSLFTTPILFVFFRWLSVRFHALSWWNKILFFPFAPLYLVGMALLDSERKK